MSNTLELTRQPVEEFEPLHEEAPLPEHLAEARNAFVETLVANRLVSEEFAQHHLDNFFIEPVTEMDALKHILVGDEHGGAHHLPTILETGMDRDRQIASASNEKGRKPSKLRKEQRLRENGSFKAKNVIITEKNDQGTEFIYEKLGGSTFFPNEWSTEKVLLSILEVTHNGEEQSIDPETGVSLVSGTVDDVSMKVIVDTESNKVVSAFPIKGKKVS